MADYSRAKALYLAQLNLSPEARTNAEAPDYGLNINLALKAGFDLAGLSQEYQDFLERSTRNADGPAQFVASNTALSILGNAVIIEATADDGDGAALLAELEALGLTNGGAYSNAASGLFPIANLPQLTAMSSLAFAAPSYMETNAGSVFNQADTAMYTGDARTIYGVDGTGVTVGILSDSFDTSLTATTSYADDIASGDLPAGINVIEDFTNPTVIDEGRGMAQLVHDIAPGADLEFATAFGGEARMAANILALANNSDVIVDDVNYFQSPFFQDGLISQAVNEVFAQGKSYFSSASNDGRASYESDFRAGTVPFSQDTFHDFEFGPGTDIDQSFTIDAGEQVRLSFQWDEPFLTGAPNSGGSASDLDIFLSDGNQTVASSTRANIGLNPVEFLSYTNETGSSQTYELYIVLVDGPAPNRIKYIDVSDTAPSADAEYATNSGTSIGHNSAEGGLGVGAAYYQDTPAFGTTPPELESFSSLGGTPFYFDVAGNRLATPEMRERVDITAPNGTDTTFFGSDRDGNGLPNFTGTSAAAPHAAAIAALMLDVDGQLSPTQIYDALKSGARYILETSDGVATGVGYDDWSGHGLVRATESFDRIGFPSDRDSEGATQGTAPALGIDAPQTGTIDFYVDGQYGDRDWWRTEIYEGVTYTFDFEGSATSSGTLADPLFHGLLDETGTFVPGTFNDDGGIGRNSQLVYTATETQAVYAALGAFGDFGLGSYTISATTQDDIDDDLANARDVVVGGSAAAIIQNGADTDWFAVDLAAGVEYQVDVEGAPTGQGSLADTVLNGISLSDRVFIPGTTNDDFGGILNSQVTFVPTATETHYINVGGYADRAGTFSVSVTQTSFPDVAISNLTVSSLDIQRTDTLTFTYDISNIGDAPNADTTTGIYLSQDQTITAADTLLATEVSTASNLPGTVDSETVTSTFTIPNSIQGGTYYIGAIADVNEVITEVNETNNRSAAIEVNFDRSLGVTLTDDVGGFVGAYVFAADALQDAEAGYTLSVDVSRYPSNFFENTFIFDEGLTVNVSDPLVSTPRLTLADTGLIAVSSTGDGNVTFFGNTSDNVLTGSVGNDSLEGRDGDDTIIGGDGGDNISGDGDIDTVDYTASDSAVAVDLGLNTTSGGHARGDQLTSIENLIGSIFDDELRGGAEVNVFAGGAGADTLDGGGGSDTADYSESDARVAIDLVADTADFGHATGDELNSIENIIGSNFNDLIQGNDAANTFNGRADVDNINGRGGADLILGGTGDDLLNGGNDNDTLLGEADNDALRGNGGDDSIEGGAGADTAFGGIGNDFISGGDNNDELSGQGNNDTILGDAGNDTIRGGSGNDSIEGGDDDDDLFGQGNNDILLGGQGNDTLTGAAGADTLEGGTGDDVLRGSVGADSLNGGAGDDLLNGGASADRLVFELGNDNDTISGFQDNTDTIEIDAALVGGLTVAQLLADTSITNQVGANVVMDFGGGDVLQINSVGVADLSDDILIV